MLQALINLLEFTKLQTVKLIKDQIAFLFQKLEWLN